MLNKIKSKLPSSVRSKLSNVKAKLSNLKNKIENPKQTLAEIKDKVAEKTHETVRVATNKITQKIESHPGTFFKMALISFFVNIITISSLVVLGIVCKGGTHCEK